MDFCLQFAFACILFYFCISVSPILGNGICFIHKFENRIKENNL